MSTHQTFKCLSCDKDTIYTHEQRDGRAYAPCEHCGAKNELQQIPMPEGAPIAFKPIRIMENGT